MYTQIKELSNLESTKRDEKTKNKLYLKITACQHILFIYSTTYAIAGPHFFLFVFIL